MYNWYSMVLHMNILYKLWSEHIKNYFLNTTIRAFPYDKITENLNVPPPPYRIGKVPP
jgi:hypothetical protein